MVEKLNLQRDASRNPLFDTMFILQNMDMETISGAGVTFRPQEKNPGVSPYDLTLSAEDWKGEEITLNLDYSTRLFKQDKAERVLSHYVNILDAVADNADVRLSRIDLLSAEERRHLLMDFNKTELLYDRDLTVDELFQLQALRTPDSVAVVWENKHYSYKDLDMKSSRFAASLRKKRGRAWNNCRRDGYPLV